MGIIITEKEIKQLVEKRFLSISALSRYKEDDYKEVFITHNEVHVYDIYKKYWCVFLNVNKLEEGFYNYNILSKATNTVWSCYTLLDKDKIYRYEKIHYLYYNKELEVWEVISIDTYNKELKRSISIGITFYDSVAKIEEISKEELDRALLVYELIS